MCFVEQLLRRHASIAKFAVVGGVSFAVDYGLLLLLHRLFGLQLEVSVTIAFLSGLLVNFLLNKYWSFRAPRGASQSARQAVLYGLLVAANLIFTYLLISGLARVGIAPELSKPVATAISMVFNYVVYKLVIFR